MTEERQFDTPETGIGAEPEFDTPEPQPRTGTSDAETLHLYSQGSDVGDWIGWLELDGTVTGFVTAEGVIHRPSEPTAEGGWHATGSDVGLSPRTSTWNLARAALKRAVETPIDPEGRTDCYHLSSTVCVLQLANKAIGWAKRFEEREISAALKVLANEAERLYEIHLSWMCLAEAGDREAAALALEASSELDLESCKEQVDLYVESLGSLGSAPRDD